MVDTYDALASRWNSWSAGITPDLRSTWAHKVEKFVRTDERIIELGCGTGVPVGWTLSNRYEYIGIDTSSEMLERARDAIPTTTLLQHDMTEVQCAPGSAGAVIAFFSIPHVPRDRHAKLFSNVRSWLRPGGVFIGNLLGDDEPAGGDANWLDAGPMQWSGFDAATNVGLLGRSGFDVMDTSIVDHRGPDLFTPRHLWFTARRPG